MDKRRYPRIELKGIVADISDGKGFFTGSVHDISRFGLALEDISAKIDSHAEYLTVILDGKDGHFKLKIKPRWDTTAGRQMSIGCQIDNSPFSWTAFVMKREPASDDIWGNS